MQSVNFLAFSQRLIFFFLFALFFIFSGNCSSNLNSEVLRIALKSDPPTLDPNLATDGVSFQVLNQLGEGLTQFDEKLHVLPANAKSWNVSSDGKTYVFHLDPNYKWSDGQMVKAQDFVFSWRRLLDPNTASDYAYFLYDIVGAREFNTRQKNNPDDVAIKALDDLTLEVKLTQPLVYFPMLTTFMVTYPVREDLVKKHADLFRNPQKYVSSGAYQLQEWHPEDRLVLEKNPHYGGSAQPFYKKIVMPIVPESMTEMALFLTGDLDIASLPAIGLEKFKKDSRLRSITKLRNYYFGFQVNKSPTLDGRVRRALIQALNRSELPAILLGGEKPMSSWIPPGLFAYEENRGIGFDPIQAKQILQAIKPPPDFKNFTLHYNADETNQKIAEWAQQQWKKYLDLHVILEPREWKSYLALLSHDPPALFRMGWGADYPDPDNFMSLFVKESGNNYLGWENEDYERLIKLARGETNPILRLEYYRDAQKILLEDEAVIAPLFVSTSHYLVSSRLKTVPFNPLDFVYFKHVR